MKALSTSSQQSLKETLYSMPKPTAMCAQANGNVSDLRQFGVTGESARYWRKLKGQRSLCNVLLVMHCAHRT